MTGTGARILLVKLSSLGDVVHALPVVQDIRAAMPGAQIDWVIEKSFAPLLSPLVAQQHLKRVVTCEIRRWRKSPWSAATRREWRGFREQLQAGAYDAVIDLQGLAKSALVAWLARLAPGGKRYALANQTEGSGYEAPTRWVADVAVRLPPHIHAVQRSRQLAARALGYTPSGAPDFGLKRAAAPVFQAQPAIEKIAASTGDATVALVHGTSRADKEWPLDRWTELGRRLAASGCRVALAHGNARELATSRQIAQAIGSAAVVWPMLALDELLPALGSCQGVIGVDSGVSHIAVALGLPHVQIYNFDTAWRTGPLPGAASAPRPGQLSVFASPAPGVDAVWRAWLACRHDTPQDQLQGRP